MNNKKKIIILAQCPLLPQRQRDCPLRVGVSQGATLLSYIFAWPSLFLNFLGPLFLPFLLFILGKKCLNQNDVEFDFSIGHVLILFRFFFK